MTKLEIVLIAVSVVETMLTAYLFRKHKKQLDAERKAYEAKREEYETLIQLLPIGRSQL